jgi:hypothetical protein
MTDQPITLDQLSEAVTSGVLRAISAHRLEARDTPGDLSRMLLDRGIFGQVVVTCGQWPNGKEPPILPDVLKGPESPK